MTSRLGTGLAVASWPFIAAVAAIQAGNLNLAFALGALFVVVVLFTAAPWLPGLHRLRLVGAPRLKFAFTPEFGVADHLALRRRPPMRFRGVGLLVVGVKAPRGLTLEAFVTVIASPELRIQKCGPDGVATDAGTWNPPVGELANPRTGVPARCWTSPITLRAGDCTNLYFKLRPTEPGHYSVRIKTSGSEQLRAEQIQTTKIHVQYRLGESTTALIDEAEELRDELLRGAFVDGGRLMVLMLRAREAAPSLVFEMPADMDSPAGPFDERQHHLDILSRYTMALYQSQRPAIVIAD